MVVFDLLKSAGLSGQMFAAAALLLIVLYLFRGKKAASSASQKASLLWIATVSVGATLALGIILGWVDPNPTRFAQDTGAAVNAIVDWILEYVIIDIDIDI